MNSTSLKVRIACLALLAAPALALTSCSSGATVHTAGGTAPAGSAATFAELFVGYHADYEAADSPSDLADQSDLVVRGTIVSIDRGRTQVIDADAGLEDTTIVATLQVDEVLEGSLASGSRRLVYFELPNVGAINAATYKASLPVGAETVLYAVPSRPGDPTIENPLAGRPEGQPIMTPVNPQGFWLESGDGVIEVLEGDSVDAPIEDTVPASDEFPEGEE
jgi:hypothetical protein